MRESAQATTRFTRDTPPLIVSSQPLTLSLSKGERLPDDGNARHLPLTPAPEPSHA